MYLKKIKAKTAMKLTIFFVNRNYVKYQWCTSNESLCCHAFLW